MKSGDYVKIMDIDIDDIPRNDNIYEVYCIDNEGYVTLKELEFDIHITCLEKVR